MLREPAVSQVYFTPAVSLESLTLL